MPLSGLGSIIVIFQFVLACEFHDALIAWFSHCDLSICPFLWILWYTDCMVLSLWSFNLYVLVNSVIHWSHGSFSVIFNLYLWANLVLEFILWSIWMWICYVIWILNRLCDFFPCAPLTCDCEQISFCNYHIWTCSLCHILFQYDTWNTVRTFGLQIDDEYFSCDS